MARRAEFTDPISVMVTPEMKELIVTVSDAEGTGQAEVVRRWLEKGSAADGWGWEQPVGE